MIRAVRLAGAAQHLRDLHGYKIEPAERRFREKYLAELESEIDADDFTELYSQSRKLKLEEFIELCLKETGEPSAPKI